jgi:hypothetical protein
MAQKIGGGHWTTLSDEELLNTKFRTDDPENLDGLVLDVPASAQDEPFVEMAYDFRGSKHSLIRCAHCKYPNHLAGIVIKTKDGKRFLVGHDCGDKLYDVGFARLEKDFSEARDRASALRRLRNLHEALPAFCAWLSTLRRDPALRTYAIVKQDFQANLPRLWGALQSVTERSQGVLHIDDKVRDFEAETRAQNRHERELEDWNKETVTERKKLRRDGHRPPREPKFPLFTTVLKPIGVVPTPTFFKTDRNPTHYIGVVADAFHSLERPSQLNEADMARLYAYKGRRKDAVGSTARLHVSIDGARSTKEIERQLKECTALLDQLNQQLDRLREFANFYQPDTLSLLARWATERKMGGRYVAGVAALRLTRDDTGSEVTLTFPKDYKVPPASPIQIMRDALNRY